MGEYSFLTSLEEESKHGEKLLMLQVLDCMKYCLCRKNMKFNSRIRPHLRDYFVIWAYHVQMPHVSAMGYLNSADCR